MAAAQRAGRVGYDRVEHLAVIGDGRRGGDVQVRRVEEPGTEASGLARRRGYQVIHDACHEHDHDRVRVDVRYGAEGRCRERIEARIEPLLERVEVGRVEAGFGGQGIDV